LALHQKRKANWKSVGLLTYHHSWHVSERENFARDQKA